MNKIAETVTVTVDEIGLRYAVRSFFAESREKAQVILDVLPSISLNFSGKTTAEEREQDRGDGY